MPIAVLFAAYCCTIVSCRADSAVKLNCSIQNATAIDSRDPIISIAVTFSGTDWSIVHSSRSGRQFNRNSQYYIRKAVKTGEGFAWEGMSLNRPYISMIGVVRPTGPGTFSYEESVYDQRSGRAPTYYMSSICASVPQPDLEQATLHGPPLHSWNSEEEKTRHLSLEGLDITLSLTDEGGTKIPRLEATAPGIEPLSLKAENNGADVLGANFEVLRLDPKHSKKDILFSWFTGGAHCCGRILVASLIGDGWKILDLGAFDGESLEMAPIDINGDGVLDFVFPDDRFLYAFGSYADSVTTIRILAVENGQMVDRSADPSFAKLFRGNKQEKECRAHSNPACAVFVAEAARAGEFERAWTVMLRSYDHESDWDMKLCDIGPRQCENPRTTHDFPEALSNLLKRAGYIN